MSGDLGNTNRNESGLYISCYVQFHTNAILNKMDVMCCQGTAHRHHGLCACQSSQRLTCAHEIGCKALRGQRDHFLGMLISLVSYCLGRTKLCFEEKSKVFKDRHSKCLVYRVYLQLTLEYLKSIAQYLLSPIIFSLMSCNIFLSW